MLALLPVRALLPSGSLRLKADFDRFVLCNTSSLRKKRAPPPLTEPERTSPDEGASSSRRDASMQYSTVPGTAQSGMSAGWAGQRVLPSWNHSKLVCFHRYVIRTGGPTRTVTSRLAGRPGVSSTVAVTV